MHREEVSVDMILIKTGKPNNLEHLSPSYKIRTIFKHTHKSNNLKVKKNQDTVTVVT